MVEIPAQSPRRAFQTLHALQAAHGLLGTCFRAPNGPGLIPIRYSLTSGKASMAKAREEFESWESQNNKHEDLDADKQQKPKASRARGRCRERTFKERTFKAHTFKEHT